MHTFQKVFLNILSPKLKNATRYFTRGFSRDLGLNRIKVCKVLLINGN